MPFYDYKCNKCEKIVELLHEINDTDPKLCENCQSPMDKQVSASFTIISGATGTIESHKQRERQKKVKDFERAVKNRKKNFGTEAVGNPVDKPDKRHIIRKGKAIAGQHMEVNRQQFIKAAAKDSHAVQLAKDALNKSKKQ